MKFFSKIVTITCIVFSIWFAASWFDVVADNTEANPTHSPYNVFVMLTEGAN